jgi:carboxypeptidase Taq
MVGSLLQTPKLDAGTMSYAALERHQSRLSHLEHLEAIAAWDEATMMSEGGGDARAEALATLRGIIHDEAVKSEVGEWIAAAEARAGELDAWQRANVREIRRAWVRATALPSALVEATSRAESKSEQAWRKLRSDNDWNSFAPLLAEVIGKKRETATALAERLDLEPYDALLDGFEPGAKSAEIALLFARLGEFLPPFIARVVEKQKREALVRPAGPFPIDEQRRLGVELMRRLGFDFRRGRLDVSHHPFCGGVPEDVRITTRYDAADFAKAMMGVLHETGHAKYEQNLPLPWLGQAVGRARSMGVHESQSLFLEMQVSRSREFASFVAPFLAEAFPDSLRRSPGAFEPENLHVLATRVQPSFIRVDADEVTYPCHIILRFEIESALVRGELAVRDVPEAWDERMQRLLGISTRNNFRDGCMQDVHWPAGLVGYFPTYTLGALLAAQLFESAARDLPELGAALARGDLEPLDAWLRENVWSQGSLFETDELVRRATGRPLDTAAFERHLERRYLGAA